MNRIKYSLLLGLITCLNFFSQAQCAMCTASAENSLEEGSTATKGLNNGILYMMLMLILFPTVIFILYKNRKKL